MMLMERHFNVSMFCSAYSRKYQCCSDSVTVSIVRSTVHIQIFLITYLLTYGHIGANAMLILIANVG